MELRFRRLRKLELLGVDHPLNILLDAVQLADCDLPLDLLLLYQGFDADFVRYPVGKDKHRQFLV
jgi:hypothetical protein